MSEVQILPGVTMRSGANTDMPPDSASIQQVILWDIGPEKPKAPKRPTPPKGKEGDPEYDLAVIEFREAKDDYDEALKAWKKAKDDYAKWHKQNEGPIEVPFWSCDADKALEYDQLAVKEERQYQRRWYVSSRTRGHHGIPNRGLPEGVKPGKGQAELERRMQEGDADLVAALRADPVFGKQELRS